MSVETAVCNQCNLNLVSFIVHPSFTYVPFLLLDTSTNLDTQIEQSEQGTVNVEITFCNQCNLNLVSFIIHPRFTRVPS